MKKRPSKRTGAGRARDSPTANHPVFSASRGRVDAEVIECIDAMVAGKWIPGESTMALARKRGCDPDTAARWAATASRIVRLALESEGALEDVRARMVATCAKIIARFVDGDHLEARVALAGIETQAKLLGMFVERHEVKSTTSSGFDLSRLSVDEIQTLRRIQTKLLSAPIEATGESNAERIERTETSDPRLDPREG